MTYNILKMKHYQTIRELDTDIAECKLAIYLAIQKYNFPYEIAANILIDVGNGFLKDKIQQYRNQIIETND